MTCRLLSLAATTVLAASVAATADSPKPSPSPSPSPSPRARSLAEVARAKRAASPASKTASPAPEPSPGRVFTNEDLPAQPSPPAIASPGPAGTGRGTVTKLPPTAVVPPPRSSSESESGASEGAGSRSAAEQEEGWRGRATALRDAISNAEKSIPEIEDRIAGLRNDRSPTNLMDPNREQTRQAEIAKAQAQLEAMKSGLETSRQALAALEEEARRKGIPSGWLR
jgi:hypothetical protein